MILVFFKDYTSASLSKFQISIKTCSKPKTEKKYRVARNVVTFTILTFFKSGQVIFSYISLNAFLHNKNVMKTFIALRQPNVFLFSQRTNSIIYLWSRLNFKCNGDTPVDHKCLFYKLCTTNDFDYTTRYTTRRMIT